VVDDRGRGPTSTRLTSHDMTLSLSWWSPGQRKSWKDGRRTSIPHTPTNISQAWTGGDGHQVVLHHRTYTALSDLINTHLVT
jgi:hypothetical protein